MAGSISKSRIRSQRSVPGWMRLRPINGGVHVRQNQRRDDDEKADEEPARRPTEAADRKKNKRNQGQRQTDRVGQRSRSGHGFGFDNSHSLLA
jgi:hypothetical protein